MAIHNSENPWTLSHYTEQLAMGFEWKIVLSVIGTIISYLEGFYGELVWGFLFLFALDFISGIMKSRSNGIPISSKRLRESVTKLGAYMVLITALIVASKYEHSFVPIVTVMYYYFIFTELKSVIENVEAMGVNISPLLKGKIDETISTYTTTKVTETTRLDEHKGPIEVTKVIEKTQIQDTTENIEITEPIKIKPEAR